MKTTCEERLTSLNQNEITFTALCTSLLLYCPCYTSSEIKLLLIREIISLLVCNLSVGNDDIRNTAEAV